MSTNRAYFDWFQVEDLSDYLTDDRLNNIKKFIASVVVKLLNDPQYIELYYSYTSEWLDNFLSLDYEDQVEEILRTPWNVLSVPNENYSKFNSPSLTLLFASPRQLQYYNLVGGSQLVAQFIWCLCTIIWPYKTFVIVDNVEDSYVIEKSKDNIIYDIILFLEDDIIPSIAGESIIEDPLLSWQRQAISSLGDSDELSNALASVDSSRRGFPKPPNGNDRPIMML